jgi:hypothetical protein
VLKLSVLQLDHESCAGGTGKGNSRKKFHNSVYMRLHKLIVPKVQGPKMTPNSSELKAATYILILQPS